MKRTNLRNTLGAALLIGGTLVGASAIADPPQGGYGAGMMGGYGQGQGGYGSGMMGGYGGYGMGPGMMGGYGGYGMGPGMMGGYGQGHGQGGYGSGMMGGYGGYGMGPGMMGGYGGNGMGPAMMYGYGGDTLGGLNLTDDQREKITKIQEALSTKHWELMGKMQQQQFQTRGLLASGNTDDAAIGKGYKNLEGLRQQMWTSGADAQKQMDAVLTKSQREQLQRNGGRESK